APIPLSSTTSHRHLPCQPCPSSWARSTHRARQGSPMAAPFRSLIPSLRGKVLSRQSIGNVHEDLRLHPAACNKYTRGSHGQGASSHPGRSSGVCVARDMYTAVYEMHLLEDSCQDEIHHV